MVLFNLLIKPHSKSELKLYIPSRKEICNSNIMQLSQRLRGETVAETLNNILEWQEYNIEYWIERVADFKVIKLLLLLLLLFVIIVFWKTCISPNGYNITGWMRFDCLIEFFNLLIHNPLIIGLIVGGILTLLITCIIRYKYFYLTLTSIIDILCSVCLYYHIDISRILKYKKAVCRDYARLTIALLLNLCPKSDLYFVTRPNHIAAAIKINNKIYVIDQRLPIYGITTWIKKQFYRYSSLKKYKIYKIIQKEDGFDLQEENIEKYIDKNLLNEEYITLNWDDIIEEIYAAMEGKKPNFEFKLKNCAIWYDINDAITKESLYRCIKNLLRMELCGNYSKIKNIELKQKGNDIIVYLQF
jgi:predicted transglutaminase-like protease